MSDKSSKSKKNADYPVERLIGVMRALRDPKTGCPWDLEQNFKTIAPYTIEEAYEVADAIERGDMKDLREELGDLLLQPIYHAQMAAEAEIFDIYDVIKDITAKMIHRHPHVFGDLNATSSAEVNKIWDEKKSQEKETQNALDGVARALPALLRAQKLQDKAAKTGFKWAAASDALDKLEEEIDEMRAAIKSGNLAHQEEELGDILFVLANFGRMLGINPETALRRCNDKFERRFRGMEEDFKKTNKDKVFSDASTDQMMRLWQSQKSKEK